MNNQLTLTFGGKRNHFKFHQLAAMSLVLASLTWSPVVGQLDPDGSIETSVELDSGLLANEGVDTEMVVIGSVQALGASWVRLHIGDHDLGHASYLTLTSLSDGQEQRLDEKSLVDWYQWSAKFNGDAVEVALHVGAGDRDIFVRVDRLMHGIPMPGAVAAAPQSICNDFDNRALSADSRVGRSPGCTAWLVSNGAVLSAGHCPVAAGSIVEFNVPVSQANGAQVAGSVNDQYPINMASVRFENNGRGQDWLVFGLNPNASTGLRAHRVQGFFFMTWANPAIDTTLRVTGYGLDNDPPGPGGAGAPCCDVGNDGSCDFNCNSSSRAQQSTTGPLDDLDGSIIEHDVDTTPANSGSPIIWDSTGEYTIGIHTQGGCDDFLDGYDNHGTKFNRAPLAAAIQDFLGPNPVYVDWADVGLPISGNVFEPFRTVAQAVAAVSDGGIVVLVPGSYPKSAGNVFTAGADGKAMTFLAPTGAVVIGN